jgi:hypothetical protein
MTLRLPIFVAVAAVFLSATGNVGSQILPVNSSGYRVIAAPEFATGYPATARAFSWVDSERLLFLANDRQLSRTERRGDRTVVVEAVPTIHLWDLRAGTINRYRDEPLADHLCTTNGRVFYGLRRGDQKVVREGAFGQERERLATAPRVDEGGRRVHPELNEFTCNEYWYSDFPRPNGGRVFPLRDEHGLFERIGSGRDGKPRWEGSLPPLKRWVHVNGASREIPLPQETIGPPLSYSPLALGYVFARQENRIERGIANRFYLWIPKTNTVRILDLLGSKNWSALYYPTITRVGFVAKSSTPVANPRAKWDPGPAGLYLFTGSIVDTFIGVAHDVPGPAGNRPLAVEQIVSGLVDEISEVSPDGCKIAVVIDPWDREDRFFRFDVIDFCTRGR